MKSPIVATHLTIIQCPDKSLILKFGCALDGKDESVDWHSPVYIPQPLLSKFRKAFLDSIPDDVTLMVNPTQVAS
jgi:hypothetical protein